MPAPVRAAHRSRYRRGGDRLTSRRETINEGLDANAACTRASRLAGVHVRQRRFCSGSATLAARSRGWGPIELFEHPHVFAQDRRRSPGAVDSVNRDLGAADHHILVDRRDIEAAIGALSRTLREVRHGEWVSVA